MIGVSSYWLLAFACGLQSENLMNNLETVPL